MIEVNRRVAGPARGIDVDDLKIFPDGSRFEVSLPKSRHGGDADVEQGWIRLLARVVGVNPQTSVGRVGNWRIESQPDKVPLHLLFCGRGGRLCGFCHRR